MEVMFEFLLLVEFREIERLIKESYEILWYVVDGVIVMEEFINSIMVKLYKCYEIFEVEVWFYME